MDNNSHPIISYLLQGCLWEFLAALTLTIMARLFTSVLKIPWKGKHEIRFWATGIIGLTTVFLILNYGIIKPIAGASTPNLQAQIIGGAVGKSTDGTISIIYFLKMVNSGSQSVAWKWHTKIDMESGPLIEGDANEGPSQFYFAITDSKTNIPSLSTPTLPNDAYLPNMLLESPLSTGSGKEGWVCFNFRDYTAEDFERVGNKFTVSFQDCDGKITEASAIIRKKVIGDNIFSTPPVFIK